MKNNDVLDIYISHTDLDGYTSQYLMELLSEERVRRIRRGLKISKKLYFNIDYSDVFKFITNELPMVLKAVTSNYINIYVTDLNLNLALSQKLTDIKEELESNGHKVRLNLYDHHITGEESSEKFGWYFLDTTRSASKIVYDLLIKETTDDVKSKYNYNNLKNLIDAVNAADIFLVDDKNNIGAGRSLTKLIKDVDGFVLNISRLQYRNDFYKFFYDYILGNKERSKLGYIYKTMNLKPLEVFKEKINLKDKIGIEDLKVPLTRTTMALVASLKDMVHKTIREYITPNRILGSTIAEIYNMSIAYTILKGKEYSTEVIETVVGNHNGRIIKWLMYSSENLNVSDIAREVLLADTTLDFVLCYQKLGASLVCSLRSLNRADIDNLGLNKPVFNVSTLALSLNGGGHVNAAGFQVNNTSEIINTVTKKLMEFYK